MKDRIILIFEADMFESISNAQRIVKVLVKCSLKPALKMYISSLSAACSYCVPATGLMEISANLSYWDWNGLAQFRHRPLSICRLNLMHAFIISFRYTAQLCNLKTSSDKISIFELHLLRFWSVHSHPLGPFLSLTLPLSYIWYFRVFYVAI